MFNKAEFTVVVSGFKKVQNDHGMIGICDLISSNLFAVRCVRIQRGRDGYTMLRFPFRVAEDLLGCQKRLLDVCHPLTGKFRQELTELVKQEWEQKFGQEIESETQS